MPENQKKIQLVFATNNKNKIKEIKSLLPSHLEILSLEEIGCYEDIPETSATIEGNAHQKAAFVKENFGYDCFADDTGLEVEALNGAPGVFSARYSGPGKNSEANVQKLLKELENKQNRAARFKTVIALHIEEKTYSFEGICSGSITTSAKGKEGFGYDPVFQPEGYSRTFAEMTLSEKSEISHRARATRKFIDCFSKIRL